jgi:alpha-tubulin suppressor-like RCC1 family protein
MKTKISFFCILFTLISFNSALANSYADIAFGYGGHTCSVGKTGSLKCWGSNEYGQADVPNDLGKVKKVALGHNHTCALEVNGNVECWGAIDMSKKYDTKPALDISSGHNYSCAILQGSNRNNLECWGANSEQPELPHGPLSSGPLVKIKSRGPFTCIMHDDGLLPCWHTGYYYLGNNLGRFFKSFDGILHQGRYLGRLKDFKLQKYNCAISEVGELRCWHVPSSTNFFLKKVSFPKDFKNVKSISTDSESVCVLDENGVVKCADQEDPWKNPERTASNWGDYYPILYYPLSTTEKIIEIAGWSRTGHCARSETGAVYCWGRLYSKQPPSDLGPTIKLVSSGRKFCAMKVSEEVVCW